MPEELRPRNVLNTSESLSQPQQGVSGFEKSGLRIGKTEREQKYHSIASKVYSIVERMERDLEYQLQSTDSETLHEIRESVGDLINDEDASMAEALLDIDPTNEQETQKVKRLAEVNKNKHKALGRYIDKIFEENAARKEGKGKEKLVTIAEVKNEGPENPTFDARKYVDQDLANQEPFKSLEYSKLRGYVADTSKLPSTSPELDALLLSLEPASPLMKALQDEALYLAGEPAKKELINTVVLPGFAILRTEVIRKRSDLQNKNDSSEFGAWKVRVLQKPPFSDLQRKVNVSTNIADLNAGSDLYNELAGLVQLVESAISPEVTSSVVPTPFKGQAESFVRDGVLKTGKDKLAIIGKNLISFWEQKYLPSAYSEIANLNSAVLRFNAIRSRSTDSMLLYRDLQKYKTVVESKGKAYVDSLPAQLQTEGAGYISNLLRNVEDQLAILKTEARTKALIEVGVVPKISLLKRAIIDGEAPSSDKRTIEQQEQNITKGLKEVDPNIIADSFETDLKSSVAAEVQSLVDRARVVLENLGKAKTAILKGELENKTAERKQALLDLITEILKKGPAGEWGKRESKDAIENYLTRLNNLQIEARDLGVTLSQANEKADFDDAKNKTIEAIALAEKLDPNYREQLWGGMQSRLDVVTALKNDEDRKAILASIDLIPDEKERKSEKEKWSMLFEMWNGYLKGSISNDSEVRLLWVDAKASREAIKPYTKLETVRNFIHRADVAPIAKLLESYYEKPVTYQSKTKDGRNVTVTRDYAAVGDPEPDEIESGYLNIMDLLRRDVKAGKLNKGGMDFTNTPESVFNGVHHAQMIGELRFKYFAKRYANYLASPQNFKVEVLTDVNPLAGILYTLRSKGKISADTIMLWQVLRLPQNKGIYTELATSSKTNRDGTKEYLPKDAPQDPTKAGEFIKKDPTTAVRNDSVRDALELRTFLDQMATFYDNELGHVEVDEDLNILPYMWDVVSSAKSTGLTYETYMTMTSMWNGFITEASKTVTLKEPSDVAKSIKEVAGKLATFKDGYNRLTGDQKERIRKICTEVFLRYTKALFDQYNGKVKGGVFAAIEGAASHEGKTVKERFLKKAIDAFEGMQTVPGDIREEIIKILGRYKSKPFGDDLFSERKGHPLPIQIGPFKTVEGIRREEIINTMLEGFTQEEKKDTK